MTHALKQTQKFTFNSMLDNFFTGLENILGGTRSHSTSSVSVCLSVTNEKSEVIDAKFPTVIWGKKGVTIPGDIVWGDLTFSEKDSFRTYVASLFEGSLLKLSSEGLGEVYLSHAKKLFLERLLHLKLNECPEAILKVASDYIELCFKQGLAGYIPREASRPQYNLGTRADMFARVMEKELGFERSGKGSIDLVVTESLKGTPGVASPLLKYVGMAQPVLGDTVWGDFGAFAQDSKKRSVMSSFDTEMSKLLSGKAAGYASATRTLLAVRLQNLSDIECPAKVLENVLGLIRRWFRLDDHNYDLFSQDYCLNPHILNKRDSTTRSESSSQVENNLDKEDMDGSFENELALDRLCASEDFIGKASY
jgi:hypothetical protein